mgnify:CR=1 FL=1
MNARRADAIDWSAVRADFPLLQRQVHGKPLIYLDSANTGQKPGAVIDAVDDFYRRHNANVSRAVHTIGNEATDAYEATRSKLARHLNVRASELVLTSGTTFALNLVAYSWALPRLRPGDVILLTRMEHHANIVPWQLVAERTGASIRVAEVTTEGVLDLDALRAAQAELQHLVRRAGGLADDAHQLPAVGHISGVEQWLQRVRVPKDGE